MIQKEKREVSMEHYTIALMVCILLILVTMLMILRNNGIRADEIDRLESRREACLQTIWELSNASDYLTNEVWAYATSGDMVHMQNYWNEAEQNKTRNQAVQKLLHLDLTEQEEIHVMRAKAYSDALVIGESRSMRLLAESFGVSAQDMPPAVRTVELQLGEKKLTPDQKRQRAQAYLFGADYAKSKADIRDMVNAFQGDLSKRLENATTEAMAANQNAGRYSLVAVVFLVFLMLTLIGGYVRLVREKNHQLSCALEEARAASVAKSEFLSRMSHDMRTPLNGIIGMTHIASRQDNPEQTKDCLHKVDTSSHFLLGLINDILDMSKAESGQIDLRPEPYQLEAFRSYIDAVIRPLCEAKQQQFFFETDILPDLVPLLDSLRVNQIYFNLLSNAVKFTPEGGTITLRVETKRTEKDKLEISTLIRDNGIGMSEAFQKVLFDPFTQENRNDASEMRGSGLGLCIVKKNIDAMDGTISVVSQMGEGTDFHFSLRCNCVSEADVREMIQMQTQKTEVNPAFLKEMPVLLCEDHPMNQEIAKAVLTDWGMLVDVAANGREGLKRFMDSQPGYYGLILMDIRMPLMDGYETSKAIRALERPDAASVPIIAMTADAYAEDVKRCFAVGMNGHVPKPIDLSRLLESITAALKREEG